nr:protein VASP homolog [Ipomoea batatas]
MDPLLSLTDPLLAGAADAPPLAAAAPAVPEMPNLAVAPVDSQPPFAEMIMAAITALNEPGGSSSRAIAKYIERVYSNLPPGHPSLLTQHLKRMKSGGELVMVKHSYMLPGSAPPPDFTPAPGPKRKPGRPPKGKSEAQPETWAPDGAAESVFVSVGLDGGPDVPVPVPPPAAAANVVVPARRGRGRPKKLNSDGKTTGILPKPQNLNQNGGRRPGRPPKTGFVPALGVSGRPRGRPKRIAPSTGVGKLRGRGRPKAIAAGIAKKLGRPRGRPAKNTLLLGGPTVGAINVPIIDGEASRNAAYPGIDNNVGATNGVLLPPKRRGRGRPPKLPTRTAAGPAMRRGQLPRSAVNGIRKPRKLSGKPLGRPRKNAALIAAKALDSQQLAAFQDLKIKFENLKTKVRETASIIKPCLNSEAMPVTAIAALQELEALAAGDANPV